MPWQPYEALLPVFIGRAAGHGMRLFTAEAGAPAGAKVGAKPLLAIVSGPVVDVVRAFPWWLAPTWASPAPAWPRLELYVQGGSTPMQALQTATIGAARAMNAGQRAGWLDAGKQADLVIIDGNPLRQMRGIRRVRLVVKDGQVYEPMKMRQLADYYL